MPDVVTPEYASEIALGLDVWKPERMAKIFKRYGDQGNGYFMLLKSMGFVEQVSQDSYSHNEENWKHVKFTNLNLVSAPGAGVNALITLSPSDLDAGNRFYPRLWQTVLFPNDVTGQIIAIDTTTPSAPVLTVRPNKAANDIGAIAAGQQLIIISNAHSEGSGQPRGAVTGTWKYTNYTQIIKETLEVTGNELTNQTWFQMKGIKGAPWYTGGLTDMDFRMNLAIEGALLFQDSTDNTITDAATARDIQTTEGFVPYLKRVGNLYPYTPTAWGISDFDAMDRVLDQNFASSLILGMLGINFHQEVENKLKDYFQDTNIEYARKVVNSELFNSNDSLAATVNFKLLTKSERTWMFKRMKTFSNPQTYGATGYNHVHSGIFCPVNSTKDKSSGKLVRSIGCRYKGFGPYSRMAEFWQVRGAGPGLKVIALDKEYSYVRTHMGAHFKGGNQMIYAYKA